MTRIIDRAKEGAANKEYNKIVDRINFWYNRFGIDCNDSMWIVNRIDWAWKFKKITKQQMTVLCNTVIAINEGRI